MAEVINMRLAKKALARSEAEKRAAENRALFGETKAAKSLRKAEEQRARKAHDDGLILPVQPSGKGKEPPK
ncbi:Protein of unknown function DUF4169 [Rhabdaerophilaceae bacterium]